MTVLIITDVLQPYFYCQYYRIIYCGISAPGHGIEIVDGLNATDKRLIFHLMVTVQIPGSKSFGT